MTRKKEPTKRGAPRRKTTSRSVMSNKKIQAIFSALEDAIQKERDPIRRMALLRDRVMFWIMVVFGLHTSEAASLNVDSYEPTPGGSGSGGGGALRVKGPASPGSGRRFRMAFAIRPGAAEALRTYSEHVRPCLAKAGQEEAALFLDARGNRLSTATIRARFRKAARSAGIEDKLYTPHSLRHTFAVDAIRSGMSPGKAAQLAGVKSRWPACTMMTTDNTMKYYLDRTSKEGKRQERSRKRLLDDMLIGEPDPEPSKS